MNELALNSIWKLSFVWLLWCTNTVWVIWRRSGNNIFAYLECYDSNAVVKTSSPMGIWEMHILQLPCRVNLMRQILPPYPWRENLANDGSNLFTYTIFYKQIPEMSDKAYKFHWKHPNYHLYTILNSLVCYIASIWWPELY